MNDQPRHHALDAARRVARNTGFQVVGDIASKLAILALYVVMARSLGTEGFGDFTFAVSLVLFIELAGLGTDLIVTRDIARDREDVHRVFWNTNAIKLLTGTVGLLIVIVVAVFGDYDAEVRGTLAILAIAKMIELFAQTIQATFRGLEDFAPVALSLVLQRFVIAITGATAMIAFGAGLVPVAFLYLAGTLVALGYIGARLAREGIKPQRSVSRTAARALLAVSLPLGAGAALGAVLARIDIVILSFLTSNVIVGLYGAAYRLFEGTLFLTWAFGTAMLPMFARLGADTTPTPAKAFELGTKVIVTALMPVAAAFALFAGPLTEGLYGESYADAAGALRWLAVPTLLYGPYVLGSVLLAASHRERVVGWLTALALIVNVALNFALIPPYSLDGAAAAMAITQVVLTGLIVWFGLRTVGTFSPWRILAGPTAGAGAMGLVALGLGTGAGQLLLAGLAYTPVLVMVERKLFPGDVQLVLRTIRRERQPV